MQPENTLAVVLLRPCWGSCMQKPLLLKYLLQLRQPLQLLAHPPVLAHQAWPLMNNQYPPKRDKPRQLETPKRRKLEMTHSNFNSVQQPTAQESQLEIYQLNCNGRRGKVSELKIYIYTKKTRNSMFMQNLAKEEWAQISWVSILMAASNRRERWLGNSSKGGRYF